MSMIDAHHHVWDLTVRDQDWISGPDMAVIHRNFGIDDLRPLAQEAGVSGTVLVQTVTVPEETPEMLAIAQAEQLVRGVVGWADLTSPALAERLAELRAGEGGEYLIAIRHQVQGEPDLDWLRRGNVVRGLRQVAAAGLAYDLVIRPEQLPSAAYAATAVPELTFVLDHAGKPPIATGAVQPWAADIRAFAARPNTVCKLSGLVTEAAPDAATVAFEPYVVVILEAFGPARLMFGSDWPVCLLAGDYARVVELAQILTAGLSEGEREDVFAGTAARAYGIAGSPAQVNGDGSWRLPTRPSTR
jgi:L-fuconolactonase